MCPTPTQTQRFTVDISSDLVFADPQLEHQYRAQSTEAQKKLDIQFHYARSATWAAVGLRMLRNHSAGSNLAAAAIVLLGACTTLLPAFAHSWRNRQAYIRIRPAVVLADNLLQVALGCFTHAHIYPEAAASWRDASPWRAAAVLLSGSGVAWLNMSGLLGSLIFRYAIIQQAALAILMMASSREICARSFSLQAGYMFVRSQLPLALPPAPAPGSNEDARLAVEVCLRYQPVALLALGMLAPTLYLFWREMSSRAQFARQLAARAEGGGNVALSPPPSLLNYWAFAGPAVALLWLYVGI